MCAEDFKVLIIGASIAGLSLANMLERAGIDFLVLEGYPKVAPDVGAGIGMFPSGARILDQLGCFDKIKDPVVESFGNAHWRGVDGKLYSRHSNVSYHFEKRYGYSPVFLERRALVQALYDNLEDKSKVVTSKKVVRLTHHPSKVEAHVVDDSTYSGSILVGADGIHSTVRKEMWRIADEIEPGYIPPSDHAGIPSDYCCMFGISDPMPDIPADSAMQIVGKRYSMLINQGAGRRIYWFLFVKLEHTTVGLYETIPRFGKEDEIAMIQQYGDARITDKVTLEDLYNHRRAATVTALPEFVFSKWHFGRVIITGDAAHKFNPVSGQGGNGAIETAATLSNQIVRLVQARPKGHSIQNSEIQAAFQKTQSIRYRRAWEMVKSGHELQRLQAMETPFMQLIATRVVPRQDKEMLFKMFAEYFYPAVRIEYLAVPRLDRFDPFHDELPNKRIETSKLSTTLIIAVLGVITSYAMKSICSSTISDTLMSFSIYSVSAPDSSLSADQQSLASMSILYYTLATLPAMCLVWTVEAYRTGTRGTLTSWPIVFNMGQIYNLQVAVPLYYLVSVMTTKDTFYNQAAGRIVPVSVSKTLLPALCLGCLIPIVLAMLTRDDSSFGLAVNASWRCIPLCVGGLTYAFSRFLEQLEKPSEADMYQLRDVFLLQSAYAISFFFAAASHIGLSIYKTVHLHLPLICFSAPESSVKFSICHFALFFWCLYGVVEIRRLGFVSTYQALIAGVAVVVGQVFVGPGATYTALWWWRETKWSDISIGKKGYM